MMEVTSGTSIAAAQVVRFALLSFSLFSFPHLCLFPFMVVAVVFPDSYPNY